MKSAKVQGISFAEGVLRVGAPLGKSTCMWVDGVYLGIEDPTGGEVVVWEQKHRVAHELGLEDDRAKQIGKKRFANDRGASVVQERR